MKVAQVSMHYFPITGGQEIYVHAINKLCATAGIQTAVFQSRPPGLTTMPDDVYALPGLRFFHRFGTGLDWFWFNVLLHFQWASLRRYDVVVCHYPFHYPALRWHDRAIVISHGVDWPARATTMLDKCKERAANMLVGSRALVVANDTNFPRALGIAVSPGTQLFEKVADSIWIIPNCVDAARFRPRNIERQKTILVPRNIRKSRGIHLAIEAFGYFLEQFPDYRMIIAGGPLRGDYYEACRASIRASGLEEKIAFLGHVANEDLPALYNSVMMTVIPSVAFEGTSISALESMASGTPVVSTDVGGLADLPSWKVRPTAHDIFTGMVDLLNSWEREARKQYEVTTTVFNIHNWEKAWLSVIRHAMRR